MGVLTSWTEPQPLRNATVAMSHGLDMVARETGCGGGAEEGT